MLFTFTTLFLKTQLWTISFFSKVSVRLATNPTQKFDAEISFLNISTDSTSYQWNGIIFKQKLSSIKEEILYIQYPLFLRPKDQ